MSEPAAHARWPPDALERVQACPVCGHPERSRLYGGLRDRLFGAPGAWDLYVCAACGSAYLDPRPTEAAIGLAYQRYFGAERPLDAPTRSDRFGRLRTAIMNGHLNGALGYALEPASLLGRLIVPFFPKRRWRAEWSVRHLRLPAGRPRLLDVGCGTGEFLIRMRDAGWEVRGIEPDPSSAAVARAAGLEVEEIGLQEARLEEQSFDAITLNHVIEHLHDPRQAVTRCRELLRPEGVLWIATPNVVAAGHRRFGPDWFGLDPPRHLVLFTPASLEALLRRTGFAVRRIRAYRADLTYPASAALQRGGDPLASDGRVPPSVRRSARRADLQAFFRPDRAEELAVLATGLEAAGASGTHA